MKKYELSLGESGRTILRVGSSYTFLTREEVTSMKNELEVVEMELNPDKDTELLDDLPPEDEPCRGCPHYGASFDDYCLTECPIYEERFINLAYKGSLESDPE